MDEQHAQTLGSALKAAMTAGGFLQADVARELNVNPAQVSRWVNGKAVPHAPTVKRLGDLLGRDLGTAFERARPEHELYLAAPITGLAPDALDRHRLQLEQVIVAANENVNGIYWGGRGIRSRDDLIAEDLATARNMHALMKCSAFLYVQFEEVVGPTSALIELGIALGRRMKTTIVMTSNLRLPFMLEGFGGVAASISALPDARIYQRASVDEVVALIARNGRELLGLN